MCLYRSPLVMVLGAETPRLPWRAAGLVVREKKGWVTARGGVGTRIVWGKAGHGVRSAFRSPRERKGVG